MIKLAAIAAGYEDVLAYAIFSELHGLTAQARQVAAAPRGVTQLSRETVVVPYYGVSLRNPPEWLAEMLPVVSYHAMGRTIEGLMQSRDIQNVVFAVNSPGGDVQGLPEFADRVAALGQTKNVVAMVDGMMASAAYWAFSSASQIVATERTDLVGSIGVKTVLYDTSEMAANEGIRAIPVDTGPHKSLGEFGVPISDESIAMVQASVDQAFGWFKASVQGNRNLNDEAFSAVSGGETFFAQQAQASGLIDSIQPRSEILSGFGRQAARPRRVALSQKLQLL